MSVWPITAIESKLTSLSFAASSPSFVWPSGFRSALPVSNDASAPSVIDCVLARTGTAAGAAAIGATTIGAGCGFGASTSFGSGARGTTGAGAASTFFTGFGAASASHSAIALASVHCAVRQHRPKGFITTSAERSRA